MWFQLSIKETKVISLSKATSKNLPEQLHGGQLAPQPEFHRLS